MPDPEINDKNAANSTDNRANEISTGVKWLAGVIITALVGLAFAWYKFIVTSRKKRLGAAKDAFAAIVNRLKTSVDKNDISGFYHRTKGELHHAVLNFEHVLDEKERPALQLHWESYKAIEKYLNQAHEAEDLRFFNDFGFYTDGKPMKPSEVVLRGLQSLLDLAK